MSLADGTFRPSALCRLYDDGARFGCALADPSGADVNLDEGDIFGERAILLGEPRAANVTVTSSTLKCYRVDREVFEVELGPLQKLMQTEMRGLMRSTMELEREMGVLASEPALG